MFLGKVDISSLCLRLESDLQVLLSFRTQRIERGRDWTNVTRFETGETVSRREGSLPRPYNK